MHQFELFEMPGEGISQAQEAEEGENSYPFSQKYQQGVEANPSEENLEEEQDAVKNNLTN